jgi:ApbE superfamily uncharacterized protein (UPF0280 family)
MHAAELEAEEYRRLVRPRGLVSTRVRVRQTDMLVSGETDLGAMALELVRAHRADIEDYIQSRPEFVRALEPIAADPKAPAVVQSMLDASARAGVGPMATVAGAMSDHVGRGLLFASREVVVENGGDVFLHVAERREMLVLAENSPLLSLKLAVGPTTRPVGVCTSSGTHGHSLSFGRADAVTIFAETAAFADAAATAVGNLIRTAADVDAGIARARELGVSGVLILVADRVGAWGCIDIVG